MSGTTGKTTETTEQTGETEQNAQAGSTETEQSDKAGSTETEQNDKQDTFDRAYVENLRTESGDYRKRATAAETELHTFRVAALGKLADPTDLPYDKEYADPEKLAAAVDELLERKPHLKARRLAGDIGQHGNNEQTDDVSLAGMLRRNA